MTMGRHEVDMLFNKLNGLEESMAQMKEELSARRSDRTLHHDLEANGNVPVPGNDPTVDGRVRRPTHTDVHGVHMKNDAVSCKLVVESAVKC